MDHNTNLKLNADKMSEILLDRQWFSRAKEQRRLEEAEAEEERRLDMERKMTAIRRASLGKYGGSSLFMFWNVCQNNICNQSIYQIRLSEQHL